MAYQYGSVILMIAIFLPLQVSVSDQGQLMTGNDIVDVSFCDLMKDKTRFIGKLVRVKAMKLTRLDGTTLYDARCSHEGVRPVLECKNKEECAEMTRALDAKTDFDGDVGRVEATLVGTLQKPSHVSPDESYYTLMIRTIESVRRVPQDVPWPGNER